MDLGAEERALLDAYLEPLELEAGQPLFDEGEAADGCVWILEGRVRVESSVAGPSGELGPGEVLGPLALVAAGPREVSAQAATPVRLTRLSRHAFARLSTDAPQLACRLLTQLVADVAARVRTVYGAVDRTRTAH